MIKRPNRVVTKRDAKAWLAWAGQSAHPEGCQCRGCILSRCILAGHLVTTPEPEPMP